MARTKKETETIKIEPLVEKLLTVKIEGDEDLILHKKSRNFIQSEVWKQNSTKGAEMPAKFLKRNKWEQLITGIWWEKPIVYHDDDIMLYTEEEWNDYIKNNRPCILTQAFCKSFSEAFKTFGFKESTKKAGTDLQRALNFTHKIAPIDFASVQAESILVPNSGIDKTNVVCNQNVFSGWSCELQMCVPDKVFPIDTVISMIQASGKYIGIGSQRKNGMGRYHIVGAQVS